jgi:hypothetical protein
MYIEIAGTTCESWEVSPAYLLFVCCFWWREALLFFFSSAAPQSTAYSEVPSQMADHLRMGSPPWAGEIAGFGPGTAG